MPKGIPGHMLTQERKEGKIKEEGTN